MCGLKLYQNSRAETNPGMFLHAVCPHCLFYQKNLFTRTLTQLFNQPVMWQRCSKKYPCRSGSRASAIVRLKCDVCDFDCRVDISTSQAGLRIPEWCEKQKNIERVTALWNVLLIRGQRKIVRLGRAARKRRVTQVITFYSCGEKIKHLSMHTTHLTLKWMDYNIR